MAKFITMRSFRNVDELSIEVDGEKDGVRCKVRPPAFNRGDEFEIGNGKDLAALSRADQIRVRLLLRNDKVIFMDNPANGGRLETLRSEIAAEKAIAKREAEKPRFSLEESMQKQFAIIAEQGKQIAALVQEVIGLKTKKI